MARLEGTLTLLVLAVAAAGGSPRGGTTTFSASGVVRVAVGSTVCDVTHYGAKGDGKTNDTEAVIHAMAACTATGEGGTVLFPAGSLHGGVPPNRDGPRYLVSFIAITGDNVALVIEAGATVLASDDRSKFPQTQKALIHADGRQGLVITGGGVFDGQGLVWWQHRDDFRPNTLTFEHCREVLIHNVTFVNSPNHVLELFADSTELSHVTVLNPPSETKSNPSHNTDAVDVHGTPFYVHDCYFNTGDDNIAAHANHTLVERCRFGHGHGASIGSLCDSWVHNITFRDVSFENTTTAVRIKTDQGCGGAVQDITYERLNLTNVGTSIDINMFYTAPAPGATTPTSATGEAAPRKSTSVRIHNITIRDVYAVGSAKAGEFLCDKDAPCTAIHLDHIQHVSHAAHTSATPTGSGLEFKCQYAHGDATSVTPKSCLES